MKITTGKAGGRSLLIPRGELRPTQDKVRQALFSSLGEALVGARVLDLFAGSGSVGLEAWSRGAEFVCFVEKDARAADVVRRNVEALQIPPADCQVIQADVAAVLARPVFDQPFGLIFVDPPYQRSQARGGRGGERRWQETVLNGVAAASMVLPNGLLVFEQGDDEPVVSVAGWEVLRDRTYGAARLVYYRRQAGP